MISHLSGIFDSLFGFPSISMSAAVWIAILICKERKHGIEYPRVDRCCRLFRALGERWVIEK
jgi:hypothetical protein